ncbi:MAG TPA: hypothetical protein PKY77_13850 [Phycisphaerae bacterium]|nr:hypothetical protein [Phycisphaerae bacterium]HRY70479.1 hypothetical protein [Phycisphaerae bacterium]HSA28208.1 hypothetical protein [Phycisphaerae bacterium]
MPANQQQYVTAPDWAKRLGVSLPHVLALINRGSVRALNVALDPAGRPRWRIPLTEVEKFELSRLASLPIKPQRRHKRPVLTGVTEYF